VSFNKTLQSFKPIQIIVFIGLCIISVLLSFVISKAGINAAVVLLGMIIGLPLIALLITNTRFGFYSVLVLSLFISLIQRLSNGLISVFLVEITLWLVLSGFILKHMRTRGNSQINWKYYKDPLTIALIIWTIYIHLQFFNPNSSGFIGKLIAIRLSWYNFIGFILALSVFEDFRQIKLFFKIILGIGLFAAIYGLTQKYFGLLPFENEWLYSSPVRMQLFIIWGQLRTWSILNDPANFGLLMAFCGLLCFILMTGPYSLNRKILLGVSGVIMSVAMVSSGTRTAFVMITVGFGIFGILTVNNFKTVAVTVSILIVFLIIYFGPFYSAPILRVRTAFQGNEDASMNVRSENKKRIRPYMLSHPIGGGPNTTGEIGKVQAPGHTLAGFPPDSGYLRIALEMGYIGLIVVLWLYYKASAKGLTLYFRTSDPEKKIIYLAITSSFLSLCTADITQLATSVKPFDFVLFSYFAMLIKLENFEESISHPNF
jgi:putative inorganic carbon (hco3(-)) transporter